jgi:hypothetical protein
VDRWRRAFGACHRLNVRHASGVHSEVVQAIVQPRTYREHGVVLDQLRLMTQLVSL